MRPILSFDIEEPRHMNMGKSAAANPDLEKGISEVLTLLKENNARATFFIVAELAYKHGGLMRRLVKDDHEIALHSFSHKLVYAMSPGEFEEDLHQGKKILEDAIGKKIFGYRAPSWSVSKEATPWFWEILKKHGFKYSSSVFPRKTPLYGAPLFSRFPCQIHTPFGDILEIPVPVSEIFKIPFSGGAYFRLMPSFFRKTFERSWRKTGWPVFYYFHLRDLDLENPPDDISFTARLVNYAKRHSSRRKFERLLSEAEFVSFEDAMASLINLSRKE